MTMVGQYVIGVAHISGNASIDTLSALVRSEILSDSLYFSVSISFDSSMIIVLEKRSVELYNVHLEAHTRRVYCVVHK